MSNSTPVTWFGHGQPDLDTPPSRDALRGLCCEAASWGDEPEAMAAVAWLFGNVDEAKALVDEPELSALVGASEIWVATEDQAIDDPAKIDLLDICQDHAGPLLFATMLRVGSDMEPPSEEALAVAVDRVLGSDHVKALFWLGYSHDAAALRLDQLWRKVLGIDFGTKHELGSTALTAHQLHEAVAKAIEGDDFETLDTLKLDLDLWRHYPKLAGGTRHFRGSEVVDAADRAHRYLLAERILDAYRLDEAPPPQRLLSVASHRRLAAEGQLRDAIAHLACRDRWQAMFPMLWDLIGSANTERAFHFFREAFEQLEAVHASPNSNQD